YLPKEQDIETSETGDTIFDFPRGPKAGSCIHGIYEDLVFDDPSGMPEIIARQLERYGFESRWSPVVRSMVKCSLQKELDPESGLSLEQVPSSRMLKEMEFYFPIDAFRVERVYRAVREEEPPHGDRDITGGFMKGYIDLVFRYGEQFFILDYKTNHLGNRAEDYSQEALKVEMKEAHYDLQYHIYTAALHRYLGRRLSDYSYSHHFGGVYYLFLRGVQEGPGDTGIFFDRPGEDRIARLEKVFSREAIDG
ncbi:MAG: PD-(D/E)XK nuclease family protein, partial [Balneolaceae bacterium]|nr:PD-(D/E)XK nuclease family protein [Balneolaceae bacterium]